MKTRSTTIIFLISLHFAVGSNFVYFLEKEHSFVEPVFVPLASKHVRARRDAPPAAPAPSNTDDSNRTANVTNVPAPVAPSTASVTQTPLLGVNGTGIRKNITVPKVTDALFPDENLTDVFETIDKIKAEHNLTNLTIDTHGFYNSTFIGNKTYFDEYWANITRPNAQAHDVLSNSHRRATTLKLSFQFPFYGHPLQNITVATGGFIYTGEHVHNWLAATQYIAPLMANFDTTLTNDSYVKMVDDGEKFTALWENVTLQEDKTKEFTFAVVLHRSGDIDFAYKHVPIPVDKINDNDHPVKVGISDAYLTDRIIFLVRRKTIYEYHRVNFKNHEISNGTILRLTALPTCLQYDSCHACVNHNTGFDCMWCEAIHKCSSGTDRNKQDWMLRNCDRLPISEEGQCPAARTFNSSSQDVAYNTEGRHPDPQVIGKQSPEQKQSVDAVQAPVRAGAVAPHSPPGGVVAALVAVTLIAGLGAWALYAFKNPHTRSGQLLIKYRPSQWSWRRGEARYTAATIHM